MPETTPRPAARIAIVTGGSRGIGRNTVENLARRGITTILTYHTRRDEAEAVVAQAAEAGAQAFALSLDVGRSDGFDDFVIRLRAVLAEIGTDRFDFLINNAGTSHGKSFAETTEQELDALYNVHYKGVFFLTQKLLPLMRDGGRIVNVSSGLTRIAMPQRAAYGSIKGAVEVLTRYMAKELGPRGIAVNVVAPGAIATDFSGGVVRDNPAVNKMVAEATALGRAGVPEDVGPMIAALLGEENRWVNGQRIEVSGGMML